MRIFKKALAVVAASVMTMAMGVTAFADHTVTYHFYNAAGWETVGAWVKQGVDWSEECLPVDQCVTKDEYPDQPIWPGAKMTPEGGGWYKITCTYTAPEKGSPMIFNNYIGDSEKTDTTSEADIQKLKDAGIVCDTAKKDQTQNITIKKGALTANEYWINWDGNKKGVIAFGKSELFTDVAPAAYTEAMKKNEPAAPSTPDAPAAPSTPDAPAAPSAPKTETVKDVVTESEAAEIEKQVVVEGVAETDKIKVSKVQDDSADHKILDESSKLAGATYAVLDLKLVRDNQDVQPDKAIKVTVPVMQSIKDAKYVEVFRVDSEKSSMESLGIVSVVDGKISFETNHFSTYVFVKRANSTGTKAPTTGDSVAVSVVLLGLASAVAVVAAKKKVNA